MGGINMTKVNLPATLKQYNLDTNKMSTNISKKDPKSSIQNLSIKSLLNNLSMPATEINQRIITELLNHNLSLNQELISELNDFITDFTNKDDLQTKIKVALLLKKINLPLNKKFYNFFKNYIFSKSDLKNNIQQLLNNFDYQNKLDINNQEKNSDNQIKQEITNIKTNELTKSNLNTILKKLELPLNNKNRNIIKQMLNYKLDITKESFSALKSSTQQQNSLVKLVFAQKIEITNSNLLNQIDLSENDKLIDGLLKLTKLITEDNSFSPKITAKITKLLEQNPKLLLKLKEKLSNQEFKKTTAKLNLSKLNKKSILKKALQQEIITTIITADNLNSQSVKRSIQKLNSNNNNQLVKFLFNLSQETTSEQLKENTENLSKQLINLKAVNYETNNPLLFLPIFFKKNLELAKIKVDDQEKNSKEKDNTLQFSLAIETDKLGSVEIKTKIKNNKLNILFLTNKLKTKELIQDNLTLLKKAFQQQKFKINYVDCKIKTDPQESENKPLNLTTIDFTI